MTAAVDLNLFFSDVTFLISAVSSALQLSSVLPVHRPMLGSHTAF